MNIAELFTEDRAVSPVIGVILMVAITVILAAVIGTFVLGLGDSVGETKTASVDFDWDNAADANNSTLTATHEGGDRIEDGETVELVLNGNSTSESNGWSVGDTLEHDGIEWEEGDTARVVWTSENEESTATLGRSNAPNNSPS